MKINSYLVWILLGIALIAWFWNNPNFGKAVNSPSYIDKFEINSHHLNRKVKIWVYLPPDYLKSEGKLPVLYMHDGQNLFHPELSFAGEWQVDESLDELFQENGFQLVVIGIENGGQNRINELTPYPNPDHGGGEAERYLSFIFDELMPQAESQYNISQHASQRGMMGSSLGGLISFYTAFQHPDKFSKFGVYSPSFWFNNKIFDLAENHKLPAENKMLLMMGDDEKQGHLNVLKMEKLLKSTQNFHLKTDIIPGGQHNEQFWSQHFKQDVWWLFNQ
ncbi:MAG: alpha/beta hydrolase-fold protein [Flavobacteriaceae bacterium]|nr:alpha/beta hydrolase-fold protein [Flavobacteriaceae bacterium]